MKVIIPSAGNASRMPDAPHGCKSLVELLEQRIIEWQLGSLPDEAEVTVVVKHRASRLFRDLPIEVVAHDESDGPVGAVLAAIPDEPFIVIFSDTLFDCLPADPRDYVGIGITRGGRPWELHSTDGVVKRKHVPEWQVQAVHCGIYQFTDPDAFRFHAVEWRQWHNLLYQHKIRNDQLIPGWVDVGDEEALARVEKAFIDG